MHRLACVDIRAFALQLLLKKQPDWRGMPAAVVAEEKPQAFLLWVNEKAWKLGIRPGQRYAAALALTSCLRAGTVSPTAIEKELAELTERLRHFTPEVEPAAGSWHSPGLFWLNASGLHRLFPSLETWASAIRVDLDKAGYDASIAVGFTRFGTYAVARAMQGQKIFENRRQEENLARRVPLARLDLPPNAQQTFVKLRIETVADLLRLPAKGVLKRFGPEVHRLHRLAAGDLFSPLQPSPPGEPLERRIELPAPETDSERLLFFIKQSLDSLLEELYAKSLALSGLALGLELDDRSRLTETLSPAAPTLDARQILGLVRLRLETLLLDAGVVELMLTAEAIRTPQEQLSLLVEKPRRDPKSCEAFARLRAEFGDEAVVLAELENGHLPTARFRWKPYKRSSRKTRGSPQGRTLIRRIYERPIALPPRSRHEPDGWLLRGLEFGPVKSFLGPYILSGGWWRRGVHREYYFVRMQQGDVYWVFYDRNRRQWFMEGRVE